MITLVINVAIAILVLGLLYALLVWALGLAGIPFPARVLQIIFAILALLVILSLFTGHAPAWCTLH